jgi:acyl dehydratase
MSGNGPRAFELYRAAVGQPEGHGDWITIDQARIDAFADVTEDHQFIHVDPEACRTSSPYGVPIAHGFLTLSLLTRLLQTVPQPPERVEGAVMGINYGFEKVRFISPVKVGSRVRVSSVVAAVEAKDANTLQITRTLTVEIDGESKPALVADWVLRTIYS